MSDQRPKCPRLTEKERFYRGVLEDAEEHGIPLAQLAEEHDVAPATLSWWKSEIRRREALRRGKRVKPKRVPREEPIDFVAVELPEDDLAMGAPEMASAFEVLLPDGVLVRIPGQFEEETVVSLLRAVRSAC